MSEHIGVRSRYEARARGYLRWYPSAWRERYGEEFVAHLESEIEERPASMSRVVNVVLHGVVTRFRLQPLWRWVAGIISVVVIAVTVVLVVIAYESFPPPLALTGTNTSSMGLQTSPTKLNSFTFNFRGPRGEAIRIVSAKLLGVAGTELPAIAGVDFTNRQVDIMDPGWPATFPKGTVSGSARVHLIDALNSPLTLSKNDSLVVAFRTPLPQRLYGVEGITLTYVHNSHHYQFTLSNGATPVTFCTVPWRGRFSSEWCDARSAAAAATETILHPPQSEKRWTPDQITAAWLYGDTASFGLEHDEMMTLAQMKYFAAIVAPPVATSGISRITLSANGIFHIIFRGSQGVKSQSCYQRDWVNTQKHYASMSTQGSCTSSSTSPTGATISE